MPKNEFFLMTQLLSLGCYLVRDMTGEETRCNEKVLPPVIVVVLVWLFFDLLACGVETPLRFDAAAPVATSISPQYNSPVAIRIDDCIWRRDEARSTSSASQRRLDGDRARLWVLPFEPDFPSSAGDFRQPDASGRSEEHTSELQSRLHIVCRLLLEKKKHTVHLIQVTNAAQVV